jgi:hypothetical protein
MHANILVSQYKDEFQRPSPQQHYPAADYMVPPDLDNIFDDLALLNDVEKLDRHAQFMQNLGFAPDAKMGDIFALEFSQSIPEKSSVLPLQNHDDPTHLDPGFFGKT